MNNELYEQSKQAVAVRHGFKNWSDLMRIVTAYPNRKHSPDQIYQQAADLYAQQVANEAVKAKVAEINAAHREPQQKMTAVQNSSREL